MESKIQSFGEKVDLKSGPNSVERKPFSGGAMQSFGEKVDLKKSGSAMDSFANISEGTRQSFGENVDLSRTPKRGWDSASTPVSTDRSTK